MNPYRGAAGAAPWELPSAWDFEKEFAYWVADRHRIDVYEWIDRKFDTCEFEGEFLEEMAELWDAEQDAQDAYDEEVQMRKANML